MSTLPITRILVDNCGDLAKESIDFNVTEDYDVGHMIVTDNTYDSTGKPSNKLRHMFAFPHQMIKKGEKVVLWTGTGIYSCQDHKAAGRQHNFYWGLHETIWNVRGDVAHLMDVRGVHNHKVPPFVKK